MGVGELWCVDPEEVFGRSGEEGEGRCPTNASDEGSGGIDDLADAQVQFISSGGRFDDGDDQAADRRKGNPTIPIIIRKPVYCLRGRSTWHREASLLQCKSEGRLARRHSCCEEITLGICTHIN